ncbi:MAG TPA: hypothetical protein VII81_04360 [Terriglobales bacterium]|jgi:hypothetical protein
MATDRPGECVLAILNQPDVAVSLTCTAPGTWRSMIFEFATKKVVFADEKPARLADAQQELLGRVAQLYGSSPPQVKWRQSFTAYGDGPNG